MEMYFHLLELKSIFTQTPWLSSLQGFQVLVETEWLDFGHKFADRCGHGENSGDVNERCPVFLQWLDCVHQLQRQFPCSFQFNEAFLVKDATHWSNNTPQQTCLSWAINCLNVCKMMLNCKLWRLNELEVAALFLGFFFFKHQLWLCVHRWSWCSTPTRVCSGHSCATARRSERRGAY